MSSITGSYLLPALLLNPVILLHASNILLSNVLPPTPSMEPFHSLPPSVMHGSTPIYPHIDMHASDRFCWSYCVVMVAAQLFAYTKVSDGRTERKERKERRLKTKTRTLELKEASEHLPCANGNGNADSYLNCDGACDLVTPRTHNKAPSDASEEYTSQSSMTDTDGEMIL